MTDRHTEFSGSIPEKYERHLGPLFFVPYAADLARRIRLPEGGRLLELACGTGIATAALRAALPASPEIVATDLNDAMLDFARRERGALPGVAFRKADASDLPFEDAEFDAVVCQFGVMFFPDKDRAAREVARVLKPGGRYAFSVWDSLEGNPIAKIATQTISRILGGSPSFFEIPFGYHETGAIRETLWKCGFADIQFATVEHAVEHPSAREIAPGFVEASPAVHEIRERASAPLEEISEAVVVALRDAFGDAPLRTELRAIVVSARRP